MSDIDKLKQWVKSGAAKPPEGETAETMIRHIDKIVNSNQGKK
jgi:hypothetical protein